MSRMPYHIYKLVHLSLFKHKNNVQTEEDIGNAAHLNVPVVRRLEDGRSAGHGEVLDRNMIAGQENGHTRSNKGAREAETL